MKKSELDTNELLIVFKLHVDNIYINKFKVFVNLASKSIFSVPLELVSGGQALHHLQLLQILTLLLLSCSYNNIIVLNHLLFVMLGEVEVLVKIVEALNCISTKLTRIFSAS
jgi:hypothetical protein